jgi:3-phytase/alkaline phosphatase D
LKTEYKNNGELDAVIGQSSTSTRIMNARSGMMCFLTKFGIAIMLQSASCGQELAKPEGSVRIASFNVALNRRHLGDLSKELATGESRSAKRLAEIIQRVRPDVLLVNELDYDEGKSASLFNEKYLAVGQNGLQPLNFSHHFSGPVNTGIQSGLDLDGNGKKGEPNDALGYGHFPGQYGMAVYSAYAFDPEKVRSFQKFLWKDMPNALWPIAPKDQQPYYSAEIVEQFRLSSKSHWDIPIRIGERTVHLLASHPTPPVFDGPEDKNGCRNHDEIRIWSDYISGKADYLYDDNGNKGGLLAGDHFVIAGDLNADPNDGDSRQGAIQQLLVNELVNSEVAPRSTGGEFWSERQGKANLKHRGDPLCDTADFEDKQVGNSRVDYALPSRSLQVLGSGIFWPKPDEPGAGAVSSSDHRLVWIDIAK